MERIHRRFHFCACVFFFAKLRLATSGDTSANHPWTRPERSSRFDARRRGLSRSSGIQRENLFRRRDRDDVLLNDTLGDNSTARFYRPPSATLNYSGGHRICDRGLTWYSVNWENRIH